MEWSTVPLGKIASSCGISKPQFKSFGATFGLIASLVSISHSPYSIETYSNMISKCQNSAFAGKRNNFTKRDLSAMKLKGRVNPPSNFTIYKNLKPISKRSYKSKGVVLLNNEASWSPTFQLKTVI